MRAFFLLLLLVNLLFLAWTQWVVAPGRETRVANAAPTAVAAGAIRLQQEVAAGSGAETAGLRAASPGIAAEATCVSLGPFLDEAEAAQAAQRLQQLGFVSRKRAAVDEVRTGLWVRVADLATPEDAANAVVALKMAGLADSAVVSDGSPGQSVTVGLFTDRAEAEQAAERVRMAGFVPETSDRTRRADVIWLDIDRQANGSLPALDAVQAGQPGAQLEMRVCPAPAGNESGLPPAAGDSPAG